MEFVLNFFFFWGGGGRILGIVIFMFGSCRVLKSLCIILVWATLNKMLETVNMQGRSGRSVG